MLHIKFITVCSSRDWCVWRMRVKRREWCKLSFEGERKETDLYLEAIFLTIKVLKIQCIYSSWILYWKNRKESRVWMWDNFYDKKRRATSLKIIASFLCHQTLEFLFDSHCLSLPLSSRVFSFRLLDKDRSQSTSCLSLELSSFVVLSLWCQQRIWCWIRSCFHGLFIFRFSRLLVVRVSLFLLFLLKKDMEIWISNRKMSERTEIFYI